MAKKEIQIQELSVELNQFSNFDKEKLITRQEWGTISLEDAREDFDRIYDIVNYLGLLPLGNLPLDIIVLIKDQIKSINGVFAKINKFSIESGAPAQQKTNFIAEVQNQADALYTKASPWIPFLAYQKGDISSNIASLSSAVVEAESLISKSKDAIKQKEEEMQGIIEKAREASAAAGAAVFTEDFKRESQELQTVATTWLKATTWLAISTLVVAIIMWYFTEADLDKGQLWQKLGSKFAILAVLISGTFWCGKIYKALMHQSSINKHRAISIQTLQAFAASAADPGAKDAVVLEATRAVFGNMPTGYIDNGSSSDGDIKILEIAKNIIPK